MQVFEGGMVSTNASTNDVSCVALKALRAECVYLRMSEMSKNLFRKVQRQPRCSTSPGVCSVGDQNASPRLMQSRF